MQEILSIAHALLLHEDSSRLYADNDDTYRRYERTLRSYYRMAWQQHDCSHCRESIYPGDMYQAYVHVSHPPRLIGGKHRRLWVEKHHYPECPDDMRDIEEEMRREWEREDEARRAAERHAA
ncbi:MAG: hypothetical protein KBD27_01680 [Candidatus Moranbacteria bacterium]|nr:hypothetical protein [Candidatus Moranbacteria bacterium]